MAEVAERIARDGRPLAGGADAPRDPTARETYRRLMWLFAHGIIWPGAITLILCFLALEMNWAQWLKLLPMIPPGVLLYTIPEAFLVHRQFRPLGRALVRLDHGREPRQAALSRALVRALNLPYYSFLRVTLIRGLLGATSAFLALNVANWGWHGGFQPWQIVMFPALVLFFACPAYGMIEYFIWSQHLEPLVERLWKHCSELELADQRTLIAVRLKTKLLYLCVFITALPLLFIAATLLFKVHLLLQGLGVADTLAQMWPMLRWLLGALVVCLTCALAVSLLTAQEVSRAAARLIGGMNEVERGNLAVDLKILGTDEYADLTRGFNLMIDGLREEVRLLEVSQALSGEIKLEALISRILRAAAELLDADRATLFVHDAERNELRTRYADGLETREIRIPADSGIAGAVFLGGVAANVEDAYADARFRQDVDQLTGYRTRNLLCLPITGKNGKRIGVTQVLNKRRGAFTRKDEQRLGAFTAQVAVTLENAQLFDDVLAIKNYNDSILASTSNGVITLDNQRRVVTANHAALAILQRPPARLIGRAAAEVFEGTNAWVLGSVEKVMRKGRSESAIDAELIVTEGEVAHVNLTAAPLVDAKGETIGSILTFEDFTREKRVKSTMVRYMSQEVADRVLEAGEAILAGQEQVVSILFSDVRGFTTFSEKLGARETVSVLNEYFEVMVEEIQRHSGILDKYIGDAIMALFGSPFVGPDDADNAVACATGMMLALAKLNARRAESGRPPMDVGIGIATGEVVVGNIGSSKRLEYAVIGDSVNLASRLEGATKQYGVSVLLSQATVDALRHPPPLREVDRIRVKGQERAVTVYESLGHDETLAGSHFLEAYAAGLAACRRRDWSEAQNALAAALAMRPNDKPAQIHLERCAHYAQNPPPADWDWVWTLSEK